MEKTEVLLKYLIVGSMIIFVSALSPCVTFFVAQHSYSESAPDQHSANSDRKVKRFFTRNFSRRNTFLKSVPLFSLYSTLNTQITCLNKDNWCL